MILIQDEVLQALTWSWTERFRKYRLQSNRSFCQDVPVSGKLHLDYYKRNYASLSIGLFWKKAGVEREIREGSLRRTLRESGPVRTSDMQTLRQPHLASFVKNLFNFVLKLKLEANVPTFPPFVSKAQTAKCCKGQLCQQHKALHLPNGNQQKGLTFV